MSVVSGKSQSFVAPQATRGPVLIVEDSDDVAEALVQLFNDEAIYSCRARHGQEALDILNEGFAPRVVVLELMMPVMDGWTFLETVGGLEKFRDLRVLVMSTAIDGKVFRHTKHCIRKPPQIDKLLRTIGLLCEDANGA